ncbi:MAG: hypothetical protein Q9162_002698 [Coniocarpon cinnabarinum]
MSTRKRANGAPSSPTSKLASSVATLSQSQSSLQSPFLPTPLEATLLALYPLTLILGSLFSTFSPWTQSTYSQLHQSYQPPSLAPSYFATKSNILNRYFVKLGWFWITLSLFLFTALASRGRRAIDVGFATMTLGFDSKTDDSTEDSNGGGRSRSVRRREEVVNRRVRVLEEKAKRLSEMSDSEKREEQDARLRRIYQTLLRWAILTGYWYCITQSFLGVSLIERVVRLTGGACVSSQNSHETLLVKSHAQCRRKGGRIAGGLDISGHVFLLVLGSGMLFLEVLPIVLPWVRGLTSGRLIRQNGKTTPLETDATPNLEDEHEQDGEVQTPTHSYATRRATRLKASNSPSTDSTIAKRPLEKPLTTQLKDYALYITSAILVLSWWMLLMTAAFFHTWVEKGSALLVAGCGLWSVYGGVRGFEGMREWVGVPGV